MKRYEHYGTPDGGGPAEAIEEAGGEWVRYEDAVAAVAVEREKHEQWKRELRQMAEDSADRGDVFAQRVLRALGPNVPHEQLV